VQVESSPASESALVKDGSVAQPSVEAASVCPGTYWYSWRYNTCFYRYGECEQYDGTDKSTCTTKNDNIKCNWKSRGKKCYQKKPPLYLRCSVVVVNEVGDYTYDDYVRFTLWGKESYKDYEDFKKDQSELPMLIEESREKCKSDGIGKIDSRVCNTINMSTFRGIAAFHYFANPGFETYGGHWLCSLFEKEQA